MHMNFTCPYCNQPTTITDPNYFSNWIKIATVDSDKGPVGFWMTASTCPNQECKKLHLTGSLHKAKVEKNIYGSTTWEPKELIQRWDLLPDSTARVFPDYVPLAIRNDYYEACKIKTLSPKASATLARRALQGMIRDFWGIQKSKLKDAIDELETRVDPITWKGIDAIRKVGNIGAHMEKNIDTIVDVDPDEAQLLLSLIERLEKEWYEERKQRQDHLDQLEKLASKKEAQRKNGK